MNTSDYRNSTAVDPAESAGTADRTRALLARTGAPSSLLRDRLATLALAALLLVLCGAGVGYLRYRHVADDLASLQRSEAESARVKEVANDYALKSLTYSYQDPDGFFRSVEDGVAQPLRDKYADAQDLLKGVMVQAQITSTGEVLASEPAKQPGEVYQVVVAASQTTRNMQRPESRVSTIILRVTVNKVGDQWQVSDIGPAGRAGSGATGLNETAVPSSPAAGQPAPVTPGPKQPR